MSISVGSTSSPDKRLRDKCAANSCGVDSEKQIIGSWRIYLSKCSNDPSRKKSHGNSKKASTSSSIDPMHVIKLSRSNVRFKQVFNALLQSAILIITLRLYKASGMILQTLVLFLTGLSQWILFQIHKDFYTIKSMIRMHSHRFFTSAPSNSTNTNAIPNKTTTTTTNISTPIVVQLKQISGRQRKAMNLIALRRQLRMYTKGSSISFLKQLNYQYIQYLINMIPLLLFAESAPFSSAFSAWMLLTTMLRCIFIVDGAIALQRVEFSQQYALSAKYNLQVNPLRFVSISLSILILISAIFLQTIELDLYLWDSIWNLAVSITTIGYGDVVPVSSPARLLVILASNFGVLFLSFITSIIQSSHELNPADVRALQEIDSQSSNLIESPESNHEQIQNKLILEEIKQPNEQQKQQLPLDQHNESIYDSIILPFKNLLQTVNESLTSNVKKHHQQATTDNNSQYSLNPKFSLDLCLKDLEYYHESIAETQDRLFSSEFVQNQQQQQPEFAVNDASFAGAGIVNRNSGGNIITPKRRNRSNPPRSSPNSSPSDPRTTITFQAMSSPLIHSYSRNLPLTTSKYNQQNHSIARASSFTKNQSPTSCQLKNTDVLEEQKHIPQPFNGSSCNSSSSASQKKYSLNCQNNNNNNNSIYRSENWSNANDEHSTPISPLTFPCNSSGNNHQHSQQNNNQLFNQFNNRTSNPNTTHERGNAGSSSCAPLTLSFQKRQQSSSDSNAFSSVLIHKFTTDAGLLSNNQERSTVQQQDEQFIKPQQQQRQRNRVRNFNEAYSIGSAGAAVAAANAYAVFPNENGFNQQKYSPKNVAAAEVAIPETHHQFDDPLPQMIFRTQRGFSNNQENVLVNTELIQFESQTEVKSIPPIYEHQELSENLSLSLDAEIPPFFYKNSIFTKNSIDEINFEL